MAVKGALRVLRAPIRRVVIPAAGLGTRLLTATKEQPKEMLPIFARGSDGRPALKPLVQVVFEQLHTFGVRDFCFVIGRGKRAIVDHFTQDSSFVERLTKAGKTSQALELRRFYAALESSSVSWVNQPDPLGFGHSLLMASQFVGKEHFMVHAGDTYISSKEPSFFSRLVRAHEANDAHATLLLLKSPPTKGYGFAIVEGRRPPFKVTEVVEKPSRPPSNLAIMPIYVFDHVIMNELKRVKPGVGNEIQLTDGIQRMIDRGYKVQAITLMKGETRLDIGTPQLYWDALRFSWKNFTKIG